jgi:hypothetical protein
VEDGSGALDIGGSKGRADQTGQAVSGQVVKIPLRMQSSPNEVAAFGLKVTYDPAILEYSGFEKGDLVKSFDIFGVNPVGAGKLKVGGVYSDGSIPKGSSGDLVWLKFTVKAGQKGDCYPLRLESLEDHVANFSTSGGCFCIRSCNGDLNGDGEVTPTDAL